MILTVTPNPSLDRTYEIPSLDRGEVVRAVGERVDPGGKGVNVSRAVTAAGRRTVAVLPLGGAPGALVADLLDAQGIEVASVPVAGATRSNVALAEADGVLTKINAPGPELSAAEQEALLDTVRRHAPGADWIACCGSLPRGLAPSWYADLVARAHVAGVRIALDTSGPALRHALRERPDLVKPNAEELAEAVGRPWPRSATHSRPPRNCARGAQAPSWPASAPTGSSWWTATAPASAAHPWPSSAATSVPAMPRSPGSCSPADGGRRRSPPPSPTGPRPSGCPAASCRARPSWTPAR